MRAQRSLRPKPDLNGLRTALHAKVLRHDAAYGLSTLFFGDGELRVPLVQAPVGTGVRVMIDARDVSIALSRPMDVSITAVFRERSLLSSPWCCPMCG
jgi:molybdate transport system ATP-binding protein